MSALEKVLAEEQETDEAYLTAVWNLVADRTEKKLQDQNKFVTVAQLKGDFTVKAAFTGFSTVKQAEACGQAASVNNSNPTEEYRCVIVPVFSSPSVYHTLRGAEHKEAARLAQANPREVLLAQQRAWYTEHPNEALPEELDKGPWDDRD